jgi:hypothetical protein
MKDNMAWMTYGVKDIPNVTRGEELYSARLDDPRTGRSFGRQINDPVRCLALVLIERVLICKCSGQRVVSINDIGANTTTVLSLPPVAIGSRPYAIGVEEVLEASWSAIFPTTLPCPYI